MELTGVELMGMEFAGLDFGLLIAGPAGIWTPEIWIPSLVLLVLFATAAWDAKTGIVPDAPLLAAALLACGGWLWLSEWQEAGMQIFTAVGIWVGIWLLNEAWYRLRGQDAVGMGDAKWTALASWLIGAWYAIAYVLLLRAAGRKVTKVYFAPFLFLGLLTALYFRAYPPQLF